MDTKMVDIKLAAPTGHGLTISPATDEFVEAMTLGHHFHETLQKISLKNKEVAARRAGTFRSRVDLAGPPTTR